MNVENMVTQHIVSGELVIGPSQPLEPPTKKELEELNELEFGMRDYMKVVQSEKCSSTGKSQER